MELRPTNIHVRRDSSDPGGVGFWALVYIAALAVWWWLA